VADPQPRTLALAVEQQREESMLGASEAGAVLGLDKYSSPMKVWRKHRGLPTDDKESEPALWGQRLEPVIRGQYALDRQRRIYVPTASYTLDRWVRATPDGIVEEPPCFASQVGVVEFNPNAEGHAPWVRKLISGGLSGLLQVKTCSAWLSEDWIGGPPAQYEAQCRVEMAVVGLPWVDIVCLIGGQKLVGPFRIERDAAIERQILARLRSFWDMVQSGTEPTVDDSDAWRLHVSEKLGRAEPVEVVADDAWREILLRWRARRNERKAAERAEESVRNEVLLKLASSGATRVDAGELGKPSAYRVAKSGTWALRCPNFWRDDDHA
jgi:predicted phage-related endonuclease